MEIGKDGIPGLQGGRGRRGEGRGKEQLFNRAVKSPLTSKNITPPNLLMRASDGSDESDSPPLAVPIIRFSCNTPPLAAESLIGVHAVPPSRISSPADNAAAVRYLPDTC
jgi:hypothetical protein